MANKNKAAKDLLVLGALGVAAAAGYFYYEEEKDHKNEQVPQGNQHQIPIKNESEDKSADEKPSSPPGTEAETKKTLWRDDEMKQQHYVHRI